MMTLTFTEFTETVSENTDDISNSLSHYHSLAHYLNYNFLLSLRFQYLMNMIFYIIQSRAIYTIFVNYSASQLPYFQAHTCQVYFVFWTMASSITLIIFKIMCVNSIASISKLENLNQITSDFTCFQTHQPQVSGSFFVVHIHRTINQFRCPHTLNTLKQRYIIIVVRTPYLAAIFQFWSYQTLVQ